MFLWKTYFNVNCWRKYFWTLADLKGKVQWYPSGGCHGGPVGGGVMWADWNNYAQLEFRWEGNTHSVS